MTNHVHLLLTPPEPGRLSAAMSRLGQRDVPVFNAKHGRTGTLWEGRFKSCLVDTQSYLFTVHRYIELNPVRAAMVDNPEHYRWSSVLASVGAAFDPLITPHMTYLHSGADAAQRGALHREWLRQAAKPSGKAKGKAKDIHHSRYQRADGGLAGFPGS
jgi:putative transposase